MDPRWQHPFTCIVAGPTGCGKTTFVARLLRNASAMIDPPPERVTWYYSEWQKAYENLADIPNMRLEEGLPTSFDNGKRGLVVLDDLMAETDSRVTNLFTKKRRDSSQLANLARQMYPGRGAFVQEAFADATASPYGYLLIDLKQNTPRRHASTHVRTAGRCIPVGLRTEVGVNLLLTGVAYRLSVEIMSGRMKKQAECLQMLIKTKNAKLREAILEHADAELIRALCECAHNILRGNVKMTPREKTRLRKYQTKLRLIARKNVSVKQKRRHLQQTGGFLPALLAPLAASVVIPLLRQLFA